jgi:hypothetical protein
MKLATLLAAKCLTGIVAEADRQRREHDSRSSTSMARPNRTARRTYAHA